MPDALLVTRDVVGNLAVAQVISGASQRLREGGSLAAYLSKEKLFSQATLDFIRLGEESARLGEMLLKQADLDEYAVKRTIDRLLALLVPGLTIFLGLIVAGLIASLLVAILSINELAL